MKREEILVNIHDSLERLNDKKATNSFRQAEVKKLLGGFEIGQFMGTYAQYLLDLSTQKVLYIDKSIEKICGIPQQDFYNKTYGEASLEFHETAEIPIVFALSQKCFEAVDKKYRKRKDVMVSIEFNFVRRDKTRGRMMVRFIPVILDKEGRILVSGGYFIDITPIKPFGQPVSQIFIKGTLTHEFKPEMVTEIPIRRNPYTEREMEILSLFAGGLTTEEVSEKTGLSQSTVYAHRRNILAKSDVQTFAKIVERLRKEVVK